MFVCFIVIATDPSRNAKQIDPPRYSGRQNRDPKPTTWRRKCSKIPSPPTRPPPPSSRLLRSPFSVLLFWCILVAPMADFWCPVNTISVPIGLFCKINDSSPPDSARFCQYLAENDYPPPASVKRCRRSPQRYSGAQNWQSGAQICVQTLLCTRF